MRIHAVSPFDSKGARVPRGIIAPMVLGAENLPDPLAARARPLLFVGNHTRFGLYDLPFLVCELYLRGFKARRHPVLNHLLVSLARLSLCLHNLLRCNLKCKHGLLPEE